MRVLDELPLPCCHLLRGWWESHSEVAVLRSLYFLGIDFRTVLSMIHGQEV